MKTKNLFNIQSLLWLALVLALAGSLRHVAHTFTSIDGDKAWGLIQAVAIDVGLFALALGITQRRRVNRPARWLWVGVVIFTGISVYANLAYGLTFTLDTLPVWVIVSKPYVLAGALPILVLYLAEIVGSDLSYAVQAAEKKRKRSERESSSTTGFASTPETAARARASRLDGKVNAKAALVDYLVNHPNASLAEAGQAIGRSKTTISVYLDELEATGCIERNGKGVEVVTQ